MAVDRARYTQRGSNIPAENSVMVDSSDLRRSANSTLSWSTSERQKRGAEKGRGCQGHEVLRDGHAEISTLGRMQTRGFKSVFRKGRKRAQAFKVRNNNGRNIVSFFKLKSKFSKRESLKKYRISFA